MNLKKLADAVIWITQLSHCRYVELGIKHGHKKFPLSNEAMLDVYEKEHVDNKTLPFEHVVRNFIRTYQLTHKWEEYIKDNPFTLEPLNKEDVFTLEPEK